MAPHSNDGIIWNGGTYEKQTHYIKYNPVFISFYCNTVLYVVLSEGIDGIQTINQQP